MLLCLPKKGGKKKKKGKELSEAELKALERAQKRYHDLHEELGGLVDASSRWARINLECSNLHSELDSPRHSVKYAIFSHLDQ